MASRTTSPVKAKSSRSSEINTGTASIAAKAKALKKVNSPTKEPTSAKEHGQSPVEDFIKCELCRNTLEDPKTLTCVHSFCRNCLVTYFTETRKAESSSLDSVCPVCRQTTKGPKNASGPKDSIDALSTNEFLRSYLEAQSLKDPQKRCDTCRRQNKDTLAIKWCRKCHDALCDKCVGFHNALKTTKQHTLIDLKDIRNEPVGNIIAVPHCNIHDGESVTKYCGKHKLVVCEKCVSENHKDCKDVKILKEAADSNKSEVLSVNETLKEEANLAKSIHENRTKADKTVDSDENDILVKIQSVRKKINENLLACEEQIIAELQGIHRKEKESIKSETKEAQRIKKSTDKILGIATNTEKYGKDSHVMQSLPDLNAQSDHYKNRLGTLNGRIKDTRINFMVDGSLERLMKGVSRLGELKVAKTSATLPTSKALKVGRSDSDPEDELDMKASRLTLNADTKSLKSIRSNKSTVSSMMFTNLVNAFSVSSPSDKETCWCTGVAYMPDGQIILVDRNNKTLKTLNSHFKLTNELRLENQPFGIARMSSSEVAVTIPRENRIDIFKVGSSLTLSKSINISDRGYGIAYAGSRFAVACACASPPSVKILDASGEEKQEICPDDKQMYIPMLFRPWYVRFNETGNMLYISDCHRGHVTCVSGTVVKHFVYKDNSLNSPRGLYVTKDGRVIVCGFGSDNVQVLDPDGNHISDVLNRTNDVIGPQDIAISTKEDTMVLTFDPSSGKSDKIYVYSIRM